MDFEEIKAFIKAGYTKEEIEKFETAGTTNNAGAAENAGGEDEKPNNDNAGKEPSNAGAENAGKVNDDFAETLKALTATVTGLSDTVKAMQAGNVANASGGRADKATYETVMQDFIQNI